MYIKCTQCFVSEDRTIPKQNVYHKAYEEKFRNKVKDVHKTESQANRDTRHVGLILIFYDYTFGITRFGIEELTNDLDIVLLVETCKHDTQRVQGLRNYNIHSMYMGYID